MTQGIYLKITHTNWQSLYNYFFIHHHVVMLTLPHQFEDYPECVSGHNCVHASDYIVESIIYGLVLISSYVG